MEKEKSIYKIRDLRCAYDKSRVVLHIEELDIPQGKVVFFVGPSGIGKSTILETLGLMNNTVLSAEKIEYSEIDLSKVWTWSDEKRSELRKNDFSFIFQQTNLMPNFTAYENVMVTTMIQGGNDVDINARVREVLEKMDLPTEDRPIQMYSGGQKQRLAFARAILPDFKVLFCDEPTGNLDPASARNLMEVLVKDLHQKQATAIIVSHDMDLSLLYADMIVLIRKENRNVMDRDDYYGKIDAQSLYLRDGDEWINQGQKMTSKELKSKLVDIYEK